MKVINFLNSNYNTLDQSQNLKEQSQLGEMPEWDLSDLSDLIDNIISNYKNYIHFAVNLQDQYKHYSYGKSGQDEFCDYFINMIKN